MGFVNWLADILADIWKVESEKPKEVDVIVPLSYGTLLGGYLANGTAKALESAIALKKEFPEAVIAFGNAPNCFPGSELVESTLKKEILWRAEISEKCILETEPVSNSVNEAYAVRERLNQAGIYPPECIIVIAGEFHSRSVKLIWKKVFPESKIVLRIFDYRLEYQADHPEFMVRGLWRYMVTSVLRQIMLRLLGLRVASRITHSPSRPFKWSRS